MQGNKKAILLALVCAAAFLASCATGTAVLVGNKRAPTTPESVKVYGTMPPDAELIAIVKAESGDGWTEQAMLDRAMKELRAQAARVGANGLVVEGINSDKGGWAWGRGFYGPTQGAEGKAIWVREP